MIRVNKNQFRELLPAQKASFLRTLSKVEQKAFLSDPSLFLFPKQVIEGNNRYILLRCGRRFGKSWAGGAYIAKRIYQGAKTLGLCGPTYNDISGIMVPSIQRWFHGKDKPTYNNLKKALVFGPKSAFHDVTVYCFTSDKEIRGYSLEALWCDEVGAWLGNSEQIKQRFYSVDTCVSEGRFPQTIITTTPITIPLFHEWKRSIDSGDKRFKLITGTMFDNPYLSDEYRQAEVAKYGNTRLGRQELFGELLEELEGALFTKARINQSRTTLTRHDCITIIIAVDPAVTSTNASDETGIIVIGLTEDRRCVVLDDLSGRYTPKEWSDVVASAWSDYDASYIIAEKNQGGDLVLANIVAGHNELKSFVKLITAKKSKMLRAEPVSNIMDDGKVLFSREFPELEKQLVEYIGTNSVSPDRMDAFVYGVTELLIKNQDLNVFQPLLKSADFSHTYRTNKQQEYVYTLGVDIRPNNTTILLGGYNKYPQIDHSFYVFDFQSGPMNVNQVVDAVRDIMKERNPLLISVNADYVAELKKYNIPAKETVANESLIEAINSDIIHNRIKLIDSNKYHSFSRLLKTFQYDGDILEKSGRFVMMQDDSFLRALLNSFSKSHHFVHKVAINSTPLTFEQKLFQQMKEDTDSMRTFGE